MGRRGVRRIERGKLKSSELDFTIRMKVMVKRQFSNFDLYIGRPLTNFSPKLISSFCEPWPPAGEVW